MTVTYETEIVADERVPLIRIVREFDAPAERVFRAHTDPELFAKWLGPRGMTTTIDHFDCRTGGAFRYTMSRPDMDFGFHGSFHDVIAPRLIVQTFTFDAEPDGVALERLVIEDLGNGRSRLVATSLCESFEARDGWLSSGMEEGVREGYEKLDELLAG